MTRQFFERVKQALLESDPLEKTQLVKSINTELQQNLFEFGRHSHIDSIDTPGRPVKPELVHPSQVAKRKLNSLPGRIALVHAISHIEFNAINLALDAAYRFQAMPSQYYSDWIRIATEEAKHFLLLTNRLTELGSYYGELTAHNGLWEMAIKTRDNVVERMALVPRVLEARGLDVTPGMIERLKAVGDHQTVAILEIILREEIGHVEVGTRWFRYACEQQGLDSESTFIRLLKQYEVSVGIGPLHIDARQQAGFSQLELNALS